jgi:3-hydroxymyristoyl/3-hydroxydecanoyl-(acyl carrier protein) dehydratase
MDLHFRAFSFIDRITSLDDKVRIRGRYTIPGGLTAFSTSLAAEAVGQLAAWAGMAAVNFRLRPIAGIGGTVEYLSSPRPGQELEISADLESLDDDAVAYDGVASADGVPVVRLKNCVGPMVPLEEFDDPEHLRDRFAILRGAGAAPGGFGGLPLIQVDRARNSSSQSRCATVHVPASADFFADHFPRRAVFPGSLLMHVNLELAAELAAELPAPATGGQWQLRAVHDVKFRAFIPPGDLLKTEVRVAEQSDRSMTVSVETRNAKRLVGGARVEFVREDGR